MSHWKQIVDTAQLVAQYVCTSDNLRMGLASVPISPGWGGDTILCRMGKPAVAIMRDPIKVYVAAERFLVSPLQLTLMM